MTLHGEIEQVFVHLLTEQPVGELGRALLAAIGSESLRVHWSFRFFTNTRPFVGPGTAPRIRSMFCSGSTPTTSRFFTVRFTPPMRPGRRLPLITRDGYAEAPIEPGCLPAVGPCDA